MSLLETRILTALEMCPGKEHAITGSALSIALVGDGSHIKKVQAAIRLLRIKGYPICGCDSGVRGYYLPLTEQEADGFYFSTRAKVRSACIMLANVQKGLNRKFHTEKYQMELELV